MKWVVFGKNAVETLEYFSMELADYFLSRGYRVFFLDFSNLEKSVDMLYRIIYGERALFLTFNCIGLSREPQLWDEESGQSFWDAMQIPCLNILVDHPMYYYKVLSSAKNMHVFCVDKDHVDFMERFYPDIPCAFLPLAGNLRRFDMLHQKADTTLPKPDRGHDTASGQAGANGAFWTSPFIEQTVEEWSRRPMDVVFTANHVPIRQVEDHLKKLQSEYQAFYYGIIEDLKAGPQQNLLEVAEAHLRRENGEVSDGELLEAMSFMTVVDLWIRTYFRVETVKSLADGGIRLHVYGKDWDQVPFRHPENLVCTSCMVDSAVCADAAAHAKISLNTMPWFKAGAHDRIFTAMLQGALSVTDGSRFLEEQFAAGDTLVYYGLSELSHLPQLLGGLLDDLERTYGIAKRGCRAAAENHTWGQRAVILEKEAEKLW